MSGEHVAPWAEDVKLRCVKSLVWYVRERHGAAALDAVAKAGQLSTAELMACARWVSQVQLEAILAEVFAIVGDEETFRAACTYRFEDVIGPTRYLLLTRTPHEVYQRAVTSAGAFSTIWRMHYTSVDRTSGRIVYESERREGRLSCVMRTAVFAALARYTGSSRATVVETRCLAQGDDACEYQLHWHDGARAGRTALGLLAGAVAAVPVALAQLAPLPFAAVVLPALGAAIAYAHQLHGLRRRDVELGTEIDAALALTEMVREYAETRREILAFHQRQREWSRLLEEQVNERTGAMRVVVERIQQMQQARASTLRGFSHDLRNPLTVLRLGVRQLERAVQGGDSHVAQLIEDLTRAAAQMERLLGELMGAASADAAGLIRVAPQRIEVAPLPDMLRRRLRALTHGRDIRVNATATREAPEAIEADPLVLDRVLDNLLTNAAKYTDRGAITIEVSGTPGFLTIKVSDTGRGISDDVIERIFQPGASPKTARAADSYGVGLSVVVQLLAQMGGRLEVMSKPDVGSTFWVIIPLAPPAAVTPQANELVEPSAERSGGRELVGRVVTIRRTVA